MTTHTYRGFDVKKIDLIADEDSAQYYFQATDGRDEFEADTYVGLRSAINEHLDRDNWNTRVFFVVDAPDINEELYTELELAADECLELAKLGHEARLRICLVRGAYNEGDGWNYDADRADTFETIKGIDYKGVL